MYGLRLIYILICTSCICTTTYQDAIVPCGSCMCWDSQTPSVDCSYKHLKSIPLDLPSQTSDLNLAGNQIDISVPVQEALCEKYPKLTNLSLAWNGLTTLLRVLRGCAYLEHLDLTGNILKFPSPVAFEDLQRLRDLSSIEVQELRQGIFQNFKKLETFNLTYHGITIEPGIFIGLSSMKKLTLTLEKVLTLPEYLFSFNDENVLESLTFKGSKVKNIPEDLLDDLDNLKELYLDLPQLMTLKLKRESKPKRLQILEISNVKNLAEDILSDMDFLETVKLHGIFNLARVDLFQTAVTVKELKITECAMTQLPAGWLDNMIALETLNLSENQLEHLDPDDFLHLTSLKYLILSNNNIQSIPTGFLKNLHATLRHLFMNGNQVKELGFETFIDLEMLEVLDLRQNIIRSIAANSFRNLPRLHSLLLSGNYINLLENVTFESFPMLRELDLAENMISYLSDTLLASKVLHLFLAANNLQTLPGKKLCEMGSLHTLGLEDNPVVCDCSVRALHKCLPHLVIHGKCSTPADVAGQNIGVVTECYPSLARLSETGIQASDLSTVAHSKSVVPTSSPTPLVSTLSLTPLVLTPSLTPLVSTPSSPAPSLLVSSPAPSSLVSLTLSNLTFGLIPSPSSMPVSGLIASTSTLVASFFSNPTTNVMISTPLFPTSSLMVSVDLFATSNMMSASFSSASELMALGSPSPDLMLAPTFNPMASPSSSPTSSLAFVHQSVEVLSATDEYDEHEIVRALVAMEILENNSQLAASSSTEHFVATVSLENYLELPVAVSTEQFVAIATESWEKISELAETAGTEHLVATESVEKNSELSITASTEHLVATESVEKNSELSVTAGTEHLVATESVEKNSELSVTASTEHLVATESVEKSSELSVTASTEHLVATENVEKNSELSVTASTEHLVATESVEKSSELSVTASTEHFVGTEIFENNSELPVTSSTEHFLVKQSVEAYLSTPELELTSVVGDTVKVSESKSLIPDMAPMTPMPAMYEEEDGYLNQATDVTIAIFTSLAVALCLLSGIWLYRKYFQSGSYNAANSSREQPPENIIQMQPLVVQRDLTPSQKPSNMTVEIADHDPQ